MSKVEKFDKCFELAIAKLDAELERGEISDDYYEICIG